MILKIISSSGENEYVRESDVEKVLCKCGGNLKIEERTVLEYNRFWTMILLCSKCGGRYGARQISDKEAEKLGFKP